MQYRQGYDTSIDCRKLQAIYNTSYADAQNIVNDCIKLTLPLM